ncbi:V-set domain-containing T-cell activation inhibitor 1-like isoform X1 [Calypte anna]|nr:V-set domain-containing T-cell activation inhibitor 1-like isoform X1 [Calypte anna]XP_030314878.1 V-set domain-containing T-cell activation inhibitor 1-like isoform X1 [Calypte anna]XP_030314884.1 V-set domain-containing T-cell activation inhibitor 1-like isoform X1 [Calypte anna]XP_030314889.1 V-set domain-containing T-cell activation inhibitor 1-like isoform X1 [Calypte anna]XP_030314895.1 V-set domain-containing T-cell activation inhibitor 1-like isoform X1 [Calypte anna]XP_030314902.1 
MKWETALWMVACFLFESLPRGQPDTTCHAFAGETVILPCTAISPGEVMLSNSMLYWQIDSVLVHFFHNGQDSLEFQDKHYQGRTSLFLDQMKHGNFSLKLSNVQLADTAEYACIYKQTGNYPNKTQKFKIKLIVSASPSIEKAATPSGQSQISSRSPTDAPCLAVLPISFHLLLSLGIWHW